jgi:hypothetical protein
MKTFNHDSSMRPVALLLGYALLLSTPNVVQSFSTTTIRSLEVPKLQSSISLRALPSQCDPPSSNSENPMDSSTALSSTYVDYMPRVLETSGEDSAVLASSRVDHQWTKQNLAIALPALMGLLADPVLSMVDTGFVGRSGPINLAALGVCTSIFHMAFTVFRASTVATTSLVGSAESDEEKRQITKLSLQFAGVLGTVVLLALRLGGPRMLSTMGVSASSPLYKPACDYLFARCWAAPAVVGRKY